MKGKEKYTVLDPTDGSLGNYRENHGKLAPRLASLDDKILAVVNNGKRNSDVFLRSLLDGIQRRYQLKDVIWVDKSNASLPMPDEMLLRLKSSHAVIAGVGD